MDNALRWTDERLAFPLELATTITVPERCALSMGLSWIGSTNRVAFVNVHDRRPLLSLRKSRTALRALPKCAQTFKSVIQVSFRMEM